jgi:hypothetical protein
MYPSTLTSFSNPSPTDRLNSPSHSSVESAQNDAVAQLEKFIGTNASAVGTLIHDIRSPDSTGGGHIQSANKGGTGQTSFAKGDILVAQSSSVLTKLAVGGDGKILIADKSQSTGITWGEPSSVFATNKISVSILNLTVSGTGTGETSIFSSTVPGSILGINNAIKTTLWFSNLQTNVNSSVLVKGIYGDASVQAVFQARNLAAQSVYGRCIFHILNSSATTQQLMMIAESPLTPGSAIGLARYDSIQIINSSIQSTASQLIGIVAAQTSSSSANHFTAQNVISEKIT